MDIKFFLNLRRKRFDFDVLPRVISKESRVPSSSYEKFLSYFKHIALFWNWIDQKPKQKHHDICDTTQLTQQIKPTKNSSRILVNLGSKSKFNWKQSWRIDLSTLVCLDPINDLEVASSDDPIIENLQKSVFQLKILLSHEELIGDNHVTFQVSLRYKFHHLIGRVFCHFRKIKFWVYLPGLNLECFNEIIDFLFAFAFGFTRAVSASIYSKFEEHRVHRIWVTLQPKTFTLRKVRTHIWKSSPRHKEPYLTFVGPEILLSAFLSFISLLDLSVRAYLKEPVIRDLLEVNVHIAL